MNILVMEGTWSLSVQGTLDKLADQITKLEQDLEVATANEVLAKESEKRLGRLLRNTEEEKITLQVRVSFQVDFFHSLRSCSLP